MISRTRLDCHASAGVQSWRVLKGWVVVHVVQNLSASQIQSSLLRVTCLPSDQSSSFVLRIARAALYEHISAFPNVVGVVVVACNLFVRTYWTESCSIPEAYHKDLHAFKRRIEPFLELIALPNQYKNSQPCSVL